MQATRARRYGSVCTYCAMRKRLRPRRMIWTVLPETLSLFTSRAATPIIDRSSIGGTSIEVLFCTTSPMIDSGSMSRIRLRFFFLTTCRLTTICGKTTVEASGMIGTSAGMSQASMSTRAFWPAAVTRSEAALSMPPFSDPFFLGLVGVLIRIRLLVGRLVRRTAQSMRRPSAKKR